MGKTTLLYLSISEAFIPKSRSGGGPGGGGGGGVGAGRPRNTIQSVHPRQKTVLKLEKIPRKWFYLSLLLVACGLWNDKLYKCFEISQRCLMVPVGWQRRKFHIQASSRPPLTTRSDPLYEKFL